MSQHDFAIASGQSGTNFRLDVEAALQALATLNAGAIGSLSATFGNLLVADTTSGHLAKRNSGDTDWDYLSPIDQRVLASAVGTSAYAITLSPAIASYKNGVIYKFIADVAAGASPTLNINGVGAKKLQRYNESGVLVDGAANCIVADQLVLAMWDTLNDAFILLNPASPLLTSLVGITGQTKNLVVTVTSDTVLTVTADELVLKNSSDQYVTLKNASLSVDITASGANGLDTGVEASSTWYAVYIIYNGSTQAGLLSTSGSSPTLPAGYTYFARLGWVRNDSSGNLMRTIQKGRLAQYVNGGSGSPAMCSGSQGSFSTPTWVAVATGAFVPSTAFKINVTVKVNNTCIMVAPNNQSGAYSSMTNFAPIVCNASANMGLSGGIVLESTNIYVAAGSDSIMACLGWEE